jgi:type I restriction-modification system DNA methylase subunit
MSNNPEINDLFLAGLEKLGFSRNKVLDDALFLVNQENHLPDLQIKFNLDTARQVGATAVYLRQQLRGGYKPQAYLYDYTDRGFNPQSEQELADIQKKIWSNGETPLACFIFNTEISILDCTKHITKEFKPEYLIKILNTAESADELYNEQFAVKIKSGVFWEQEEFRNRFKFHENSAYTALISNIQRVVLIIKGKLKGVSETLIKKIIVQAILIKYLEERCIDKNNNRLLPEKYFYKYGKSKNFTDVLRAGYFSGLLADMDKNFNGNVFKWSDDEHKELHSMDLSVVADLLETDRENIDQPEFDFDWRYFEFKFIPVELISRLYETFIGQNKREKGLYYTPAHLVRLLIDECIPLSKYENFDLENFTILDPSCGSGIFLVVAFKRLVQIWRLQNDMMYPDIKTLKRLLKNLYGVDKEEQAVQLSSFSLSLALCNELEPIAIINKLKFDDLREHNLIYSDFFICEEIKNKKFDLVIGNPPYVRGGARFYKKETINIGEICLPIPNKQIALKFLGESYNNLKDGGLQCLLIKSTALLYGTKSSNLLATIIAQKNLIQVLDFTALLEGNSLWDNARVDALAAFIRNEPPDHRKNILHLTFRRTKTVAERIIFEIDDYDVHYVNRKTALENPYIWKINLLGGGRITRVIEKLSLLKKLSDLFKDGIYGEGIIAAESLPNEAFLFDGIDNRFLTEKYLNSFKEKKDKPVFQFPNVLIKENIELPTSYNCQYLKFSDAIVGLHSKDKILLKRVVSYFKNNNDILKFFNICTSGKMLVYKNSACKEEDILNLPVDFDVDIRKMLTAIDLKIIDDVNNVIQPFLRTGPSKKGPPVKALARIKSDDMRDVFCNYGDEFSNALNQVYTKKRRKFRLTDVVKFGDTLIGTVFRYDAGSGMMNIHDDFSQLNIPHLTENKISSSLAVNRIIKLYPQKDMIVFVKPNQYRYWLSLAAYRDADRCLADFAAKGF